jgi:colanic acid biosynthesis glycosyl transferase WcaI
MRILIYGINYAPELTGIGKYTAEMAEWLAGKEHEVHVITAMPYYPEWNIHADYKGKKRHTEIIDGVHVHRVPLYVPATVSSAKRIIHEFSFVASSIPVWMKLLFQKKFDVVFTAAPPFHLGFLPLLYSGLRRSVMISHIQDLQVDAARDLGMIKNRSFLKIMFGLEKFLLKRSTKVSTISVGMKRKIEAKGIDAEDIMMFPNWVDESHIRPMTKEHSFRKEWGIGMEDKVVLYSGNLGEKQGLENIVDVASHYQHDKSVRFVICGSGGGKEKLMALANDAGLENIQFYPLQPYNRLSELLATADVHLVLQKKSAADLVMPSKLTGILAAGGCAVVTAEQGTSLYDVIDRHHSGILVEPESVTSLKDGIDRALFSDVSTIRKNARRYAEQFLAKDMIMSKLEQELFQLTECELAFSLR